MKTTIIALAGLAGALASPVLAESIAIQYRDLDLATAEGQQALEQRVDAAARKACGLDETATGTRIVTADKRRCHAEAKKSARAQMASIIAERQLGG